MQFTTANNNKAPGFYAAELRDGGLVTGVVDGVRFTLKWFPYGSTFTVLLSQAAVPNVFDLDMEQMGTPLRDLIPQLRKLEVPL